MTAFARSYARAFLDAAPSGYDVEGFLERAAVIRDALARDPRLKTFFTVPAIPQLVKRNVLDDLGRRAGMDDFASRFFNLVLAHRRLQHVSEILAAIREESDRRRGVVEALVTLAARVGPQEERRIGERLGRAVGKTVRLRIDVDQEILAGFVAQIGSEVFDASALRAIEAFSEQVKETAGA